MSTKKNLRGISLSATIFGVAVSVFPQSRDLGGYKVIQANASTTITLPAGTMIQPGGYLIIARNTTQSSFETAFGLTLGSNVGFVNGTTVIGGNGFPTINGSETYTLQSASGGTIDGPTVAEPASAGESIKRLTPGSDAGTETSWARGSTSSANPGSGMVNSNTGKVIISEFSDASNFANEFVELYFDATPPPSGIGSAIVVPSRIRYAQPTTLDIKVFAASDTLAGIRIRRPQPLSWPQPAQVMDRPGASVVASGDTVTVENVSVLPGDTIGIRLEGVISADTTDALTVIVESRSPGTSYLPLLVQPSVLVAGSPVPIATIKRKDAGGNHVLLGRWAVVRGVVTVAKEFAGPTYLQDGTAGLAVYDGAVTDSVARGDDIVLLGKVAPFSDLFELSPCTILTKVSEGNPFDTLVVTASQISGQASSEPYEGRLVRINGITTLQTTAGQPVSTWATTGSGTNYLGTDATGTVEIRVSAGITLDGKPAPTGRFDIIGVIGQYFAKYQLLPRSIADVVPEGNGPRITSSTPFESGFTATSVTLSWTTDVPATSEVRFGPTASLGQSVVDTNKVVNHVLTVAELKSATPYFMQLATQNVGGVTLSPVFLVSTVSNSPGQINVYFNKSVNSTVQSGELAQTVSLPAKLSQRIDGAKYSIDLALYSLSGTVGGTIAQALVQAKGRGVRVRVIGEKDNQGTAPWSTIRSAQIPLIDDGFDGVNAGSGLMHNKFVVIDNRDATSDADDWVWTGSWNLTDPGSNDDMQNAVEIQDKAVANAYTLEFNEMWGSSGDTAIAASSRFGARKSDNTPHRFTIAGTPVEVYFSPSDRVTSQIIRTINRATESADFAMLTMTRADIANALIARKAAGVKVRGVMDNRTDTGSEYDTLKARGIDVRLDVNPGFLHHKYLIVNGVSLSPSQWVLTGSHNWSSSAENSNNENTMIFQSARIANLYLQEFKARYLESGGTDNIVLGAGGSPAPVPERFALSAPFPNPFNPTTNFRVELPAPGRCRIGVYDLLGREVAILADEWLPAGRHDVRWNAGHASTGVYVITLEVAGLRTVQRALLVR